MKKRGPRPNPVTRRSELLRARVDVRTYDDVCRYALRRKIPLAAWVREAIAEKLRNSVAAPLTEPNRIM